MAQARPARGKGRGVTKTQKVCLIQNSKTLDKMWYLVLSPVMEKGH
jgi:hypothetical protein